MIEARIEIKTGVFVGVRDGDLFLGKGDESLLVGPVTHETLNELGIAVDRMNQHLFPELASFNVNAFLASKK